MKLVEPLREFFKVEVRELVSRWSFRYLITAIMFITTLFVCKTAHFLVADRLCDLPSLHE
jgi:hypothetical protein